MPEALKPAQMPREVEHVWSFWTALHSARGASMDGPDVIGYVDIQAWSQLTGTPLVPSEVEMIVAIERLFWKYRERKHG